MKCRVLYHNTLKKAKVGSNFITRETREKTMMNLKEKSLTLLAVTLLLFRHAVVLTMASTMNYRILENETKRAFNIVDVTKIALITQHSISEKNITQKMTKWYFGVSDCWNYSLTEEGRLNDNYIRLKIFQHQSKNISTNVVTQLGNLKQAVKRMKKKLGYPHVNIGHYQHSLPTVRPQEKRILQIVFLSIVEKNLNLMLNDFRQRISTQA